MNPIIISTIIASASIIFSIFGASWLNQRAIAQTHQDHREFTKMLMAELDKRLVEIDKRYEARFEGLNYRFDGLEAKFELRFGSLDARLASIEQRLERLEAVMFRPISPR